MAGNIRLGGQFPGGSGGGATTISAESLAGNFGTVVGTLEAIAIGTNLTLTSAGTLNASAASGTTTTIVAGNNLTGGTISTAGTIGLQTLAATSIFGNFGTVAGTMAAIGLGANLTIDASAGTLNVGTLTVPHGGTGLTSGLSGGVLAFTSTTGISSSAPLAANHLVVGGGAGLTPATIGGLGVSGNSLLSAGAGNPPAFGPINLATSVAVTGLLPFANIATLAADSLWGNSGTIGAAGSSIAIGTNITLASGTLSFSGTGGIPLTVTDGVNSVVNTGTILVNGGTISGSGGDATITVSGSGGAIGSIVTTGGLTVNGTLGGTLSSTGTIGLETIAATSLFGNAATVAGTMAAVAVGTNLSLTATGTLNATSGSFGPVVAQGGPFLANGTITTSGTISNSASSLTAHGILLGEGTSAVVATAAMTNGQLLIGATSADPAPQTMSGDATINAGGTLALGSIVAGGTVGSVSQIPVITFDTKGRITNATTVAVPVTAANLGAVLNSGTVQTENNVTLAGTAAGTLTVSPASGTKHTIINLAASGGTQTLNYAGAYAYQTSVMHLKQGATASVLVLNIGTVAGFVFGATGGPTSYTITPTPGAIDDLAILGITTAYARIEAITQGFTA